MGMDILVLNKSLLYLKFSNFFMGCLFVLSDFLTPNSFSLIFQIFVIPVLIGLLFELLVIVPMRVPVNESPVFLLYQDWALGLIFLKIWTRLVSIAFVY